MLPGIEDLESLPVLMGRSSQSDVKDAMQAKTFSSSKTLLYTPFSRSESVGSDDSLILKEILTDALVSPEASTRAEETSDAQACDTCKQQTDQIPLTTKPSSTRRSSIWEKKQDKVHSIECSNAGNFRRSDIECSNAGSFRRTGTGPLKKQETAATKVQKHYRGHRVRLQVPQWREQLETVVEEEARKVVQFVESPTAHTDEKAGRAFARKSTPFIKKEDVPPEEYGVEIVTSEIPREEPRWNLREARKLTGFIRIEDLSDTESDIEDCLNESVLEPVTPESS